MDEQLNLPLNKNCLSTGKKDQRITITCSEKFKELVDFIAKLTDTDPSKLGQRYFLEGMMKDLGEMFIAEPYLESTLREILQKNLQTGK